MQGYLSISQLSKIKGITTETLRYYDRIGLFKPDYINPESKYRYYSYAQCASLGTILMLKNVGMPLQDIKTFLNHKTAESSIELLSDMKEQLDQKIVEMQSMQNLLTSTLNRLETTVQGVELNKPEIKYKEERRILYSDVDIESLEESIYHQMIFESEINNFIQIQSSELLGSIIKLESFYDFDKAKLRRISAFLCQEDIDEDIINKSKFEQKICKAGPYLCMHAKGRLNFKSQPISFLRQYIDEHHYVAKSDLLEFDEIGLDITNDINEVVVRLEIRIQD